MTLSEQYKNETGEDAAIYTTIPHYYFNNYVAWLEKKAEYNELEHRRRIAAEKTIDRAFYFMNPFDFSMFKKSDEYIDWQKSVKAMEIPTPEVKGNEMEGKDKQ